MTLKIKPHAVDQDSGTFIFPSVLVTDSIITGSVTVFDESVLMGQADAFNFAGDNVEAVISGTTAHIMVTGTAGGGGGHETGTMVIYEENIFLGVFEEMRFIGDGVTALNSGSYAAIAITGTAGGGGHETGTMVIYDEGDFLGVFEEMRFIGDGVDAYNSGSYVAVSIPSGGASGGTSVTVTTGTFYTEEVLYDVTLESSTGSVVFANIPQDYDHLQIKIVGRSTTVTTSEFILIAYNGDTTAANYRYANHHAGTAHGVSVGHDRRIGIADGASALAGQYGLNLVEILDYTVTGTLVVSRTIAGDRSSADTIYNRDLFLAWEKYEAITRIDLEPNTNNFDVGSHFQLIGIKETVLVTSVEGGGASGGTPVSVTTGTFYVETLLDEVYLESTTGSIIMPGISQEYDHLKIIGSLRGSESAEATNVNINFNGDSTEANYKAARHIGGTVHSSNVGDWPIIGACPAATALAGAFGSVESFIPDYTNPTKRALAETIMGQRTSEGTLYAHHHHVSWESTAAVNRVDIIPRLTDGFVSGTWVQLFGMREETVVTSIEGGGVVADIIRMQVFN